MKQIPELDGLRGIAATGVVIFHWFPTYTFWMWSFVDLFFVLSGFLISRILLESLRNGHFSLRDFWVRRILRIWPVYYLTLAGIAVYLCLTHGVDFLRARYSSDLLLSLVYLQFTPFFLLNHGDPWAMFNFLPGFLHSWSLAVEEQFYMLWPLALAVLFRHARLRTIGWVCACVAMLGPVARAFGGFPPVLLFSRVEGLALGVLLAVIATTEDTIGASPARAWKMAGYAVAALVGGIAALPYLVRGYTEQAGPADIFDDPTLISDFALLYFGVVGLTLVGQGGRMTWLLRTPALTYLGGISYAMYMFHFPILVFIEPKLSALIGKEHGVLAIAVTGLLLVGLPHCSKILIERPFLTLKRHFAAKV